MKKKTERLVLAAGSLARDTLDYLIALIPVYLWSIFAFGIPDVHRVLALSFSTSFILSMCMQFAMYRRAVLRKLLRATVYGLVLGFLMPVNAPMWLVILGAFIANVPYYLPFVGKYLNEYLHPIALTVVALSLFSVMTPRSDLLLLDGASPVSPMSSLLGGYLPEEGIYDLLLGRHSGLMGEVSILMILVGGVYLYFRKLVRLQAPLVMLATLAVLSYAFPVMGTRLDFLIAQMFSGGVFFVAVFLMPFYGTMPYTGLGRVLYGFLCGFLTYVLRRFYHGYDGVYLALLISGAFLRLIEPLTVGKPIQWKSDF